MIGLQETRGREETNFDAGYVERGNHDHSQVAVCVVNCPSNFALTLDLKSAGYSLKLGDSAGASHRALKVFRVGRNGDAPTRVPYDGSTVRRTSESVSHACWRLQCHSERSGASKVDVRDDLVSSVALLIRPWCRDERIRGAVSGNRMVFRSACWLLALSVRVAIQGSSSSLVERIRCIWRARRAEALRLTLE